MEKLIKYLLYFIIVVKVLFILSIIRYKIMLNIEKDKKTSKNIYKRKEILHEAFVFLMYILLILLFNPFQKNIKLNDNPTESRHLQIAIFALGVIELLNFDYNLILKAPQQFLSSL
tara:strand:- start:297 stop:644 length:348 start_codon:yes stop_codon:yes gene_type:complete